MKFEYSPKTVGVEPVAYIDETGDLLIKNREGAAISSCRTCDDWVGNYDWDPEEPGILRKFYPGDKLTITF